MRALTDAEAEKDVVIAALRAFPLGESIWRLGVQDLWMKGLTGKGVKVAVIDNGVDFKHPDFAGVKHASYNLTRDRGDDTKGEHGTPMADIIHAIAPDAEIQSYQVLSNSELPGVSLSAEETDTAIFKAMDMARANGARLISMSLGATGGYANDKMAAKVAEFKKQGIVVVISAGNSGRGVPAGYQVGTPGTAPDAITIGAVDYHGHKADFSSSGPVFNPNNPMALEDKPDLYAFGVNNKAAMALPTPLYGEEPVPYDYISGTSPATPHVTGVVALMLEAARQAGLDVTNGPVVASARAALLAATKFVSTKDDLPSLQVLSSAQTAVDAFLKLLKPETSAPEKKK
jgi:subtilisin family serine protease